MEEKLLNRLKKLVLDNVDIVNVIGKRVSLFKKGDFYYGTCPFHFDNLVSLSVDERTQTYSCATCDKSGNVIDFIKNYYYLSDEKACLKLLGEEQDKNKNNTRIELCSRSNNSISKGLVTIKELVNRAKELGIKGLALCDEYSTNGYEEFTKECLNAKIKPYYGVTVDVDFDRIIIIAKNIEGIRNINEIISLSSSMALQPLLDKYSDNLLTIGLPENKEQIDSFAKVYDYIGFRPALNELALETSFKYTNIIAVSDSYYLQRKESILFNALNGFETKENRILYSGDELKEYFFGFLVYENVFELCSNISDFTYECKRKNSNYDQTINENLKEETIHALDNLSDEDKNQLKEETLKELYGVISSGHAKSLLIYKFITRFLRDSGEPYIVRGTSNNSYLCYVLGITNVNPTKYGVENKFSAGFDYCKAPLINLVVPSSFKEQLEKKLIEMFDEENIIKGSVLDFYSSSEARTIFNTHLDYFEKKYLLNDLFKVSPYLIAKAVKDICPSEECYYIKDVNESFYDYTPLRRNGEDLIPFLLNPNASSLNYFFHLNISYSDSLILDKFFISNPDLDIDKNYYSEHLLSLFTHDQILNKRRKVIDGLNPLAGITGLDTPFAQEVIKKVKPKTFDDLVLIEGYIHGTKVYRDNQEHLLGKGVNADLFSNRDDVYFLLRDKYKLPNEDAFNITELIRKGRDLNFVTKHLLMSYGVPNETISSLAKIKYLYSKGMAVEGVLRELRQIYLKVYYPAIFYSYLLMFNYDHDLVADFISRPIDEIKEYSFKDDSASDEERSLTEILIEIYERGYRVFDKNESFVVDEEKVELSKPKSNIDLVYLDYVLSKEMITLSKLQRELSIGFVKAGKLLNALIDEGVVTEIQEKKGYYKVIK